jgi:hypothetical protein
MRGLWRAVAALLLAASAHADVELVVVGPGDPLWSRFGHVLLRVDDRCYDFAANRHYDAWFAWDYLRGVARFRVAEEPWGRMMRRNVARDRSIWIRPLLLSDGERARLGDMLAAATAPDRCSYLYEHQHDNCVTRLRDVLDEVTAGALRRTERRGGTYREATMAALAGAIGPQLAVDLIAGRQQEIEPEPWARCYLPDRLDEVVALAMREDGTPFAGPRRTHYLRRGPPVHRGGPYEGRIVVTVSALAVALALLLSRRVGGACLLLVAPLFAGAGGALWTLAACSSVKDYAWSDNALLFWPTDLILVATGWRRVRGRTGLTALARRYVLVRLVGTGLYAAAKVAGAFPQDNWAFVGAAALVLLAVRVDR